ncbi:hypothetical protein COY27_06370 [Candidatus Woesearchaeota archaeon CG_4_10_14_0_2_um_filter_33_13]|nr:MAG: hypothetical protein COY27_06370 [Candidatus Woesearchaeota archaeon CG_4_10_14_0_2_um_filter_33_13]
MIKKKQILRLEVNKEFRYDGDIKNHQHFICKNCRKIIDLQYPQLNNKIIKKTYLPNAKIDSVDIIFNGLCEHCV